MHIGIDARAITDEFKSGVPRYVRELFMEMASSRPNITFHCFSQYAAPDWLPDNAVWHQEPIEYFRNIRLNMWLILRMHKLIAKTPVSVFWAGCGFLPKKLKNIKYCLSVMDLTYLLFPETMSRGNLITSRLFCHRSIKKADAVTTISKGTSKRLAQHLNIAKAEIIPTSVDLTTFNTEKKSSSSSRTIADPYLLCVSTVEPRKNYDLLIKVFDQLKRKGSFSGKLVIVGRPGWGCLKTISEIENHPDITFLQNVNDDEHLSELYRNADCFICLTKYEGYGMPFAEARSCGIRIIASDTWETREAAGSNAFYVKLSSPEEIADKIIAADALNQPQNHNLSFPTWKESSEKLLKLLLSMK